MRSQQSNRLELGFHKVERFMKARDKNLPMAPFSSRSKRRLLRELGIPAVVSCVSATTRLQTGDRVVVDGGQGIVQKL